MKKQQFCATRAHALQQVWELPLFVDDHANTAATPHKVLASIRRAHAA